MPRTTRDRDPARKRAGRFIQGLYSRHLLRIERAITSRDDKDLAALAAELRSLDQGNCAAGKYYARDYLLTIVRHEQAERARQRQLVADELEL